MAVSAAINRVVRALTTEVPAGWPRLLDYGTSAAVVLISLAGASAMAWTLFSTARAT